MNEKCKFGGNLRRLCKEECDVCYNKSFASSNRVHFWSDKNKLKPREVFLASGNKYWFCCDECLHEFEIKLDSIKKNQWCSYCVNQKLCEKDTCNTCFNKSFASSPLIKYWSSKNKVKPRDVFLRSNVKCIFNCDKCPHDFESSLSNIKNGRWCPYCSNPPQKLCKDDNCAQCFSKSFASSPMIRFWNSKNKVNPRDVFLSSNFKHWFNCNICIHEFQISLSDISTGRFCPYCSNPPKLLCKNDSCEQCFNKSFASSSLSKYWSSKNKVKPRDVFLASNNKYWVDCNKCFRDFEISPANIKYGSFCPHCVNKTESKLLDYLLTKYPDVQRQFKLDSIKSFRFDFQISVFIIELDGEQHFKQVSNWALPEETIKNDCYKMNAAIGEGYHILRILQEDVWNDRIDWKTMIDEYLNSAFDRPTIVFCHNSKYEKHVETLNYGEEDDVDLIIYEIEN